jgi:TonB family protein
MAIARAILFFVFYLVSIEGSAAQEAGQESQEQVLPALNTLPCIKDCGNFIAAVAINKPLPAYPNGNIGFAEGYVWVRFKILEDGHVTDVSAMEFLGPQEFSDRAVAAVKNWIYKPATLNGKPLVEQDRLTMITFDSNAANKYRIASPEFTHIYRSAVADVKDGKLDEGLTKLRDAQVAPKFTFYERGMLGNLGSKVAYEKKDYLQAHALSTLATIWGTRELEAPVLQSLLQTRIESAAALGDIVDMLDTFERLKQMKGFELASPIAQLVTDTRAKADGMPVFGMTASIPLGGTGGQYGLYRRIFTFKDVSGSLESFFLGCDRGAVSSKISDNAEWHVPVSWSNCRLSISGTPGTTFKIVQANE